MKNTIPEDIRALLPELYGPRGTAAETKICTPGSGCGPGEKGTSFDITKMLGAGSSQAGGNGGNDAGLAGLLRKYGPSATREAE